MAVRGTKKEGNHVGYNIRRLREIIGVKQYALAESCGWSQQQISKIENCSRLNEKALEKVAKALGVSPKLILEFDEGILLIVLNSLHEFDFFTNEFNYNSVEVDLKNVVNVVFSEDVLREKCFQTLISSIDDFENNIRILKDNLCQYFK